MFFHDFFGGRTEKTMPSEKGSSESTSSSSASPPSVIIWYISLSRIVITEKPAMNSSRRCLRSASCAPRSESRFAVTASSSAWRRRNSAAFLRHSAIAAMFGFIFAINSSMVVISVLMVDALCFASCSGVNSTSPAAFSSAFSAPSSPSSLSSAASPSSASLASPSSPSTFASPSTWPSTLASAAAAASSERSRSWSWANSSLRASNLASQCLATPCDSLSAFVASDTSFSRSTWAARSLETAALTRSYSASISASDFFFSSSSFVVSV
mmetsp:Transcript_46776/g.111354  ORF Transcript_46776/g.111354 Transcript_46776/m.111354 type:complete len:269 (-) Transcript_46776:2517-3323(-)